MAFKQDGGPATSPPLLEPAVRLWAVAQILRCINKEGVGPTFVDQVLHKATLVTLSLCMMLPSRPFLIVCAGAARIWIACAQMPFITDGQHWDLLWNAALLFGVLGAWLASHSTSNVSWLAHSFSSSEQHSLVVQLAPTIRTMHIVFYLAAAGWKMNSSFLDASYSCAPLFMAMMLDHAPQSLLAPSGTISRVLLRASPFKVIFVEGGVAMFLMAPAHSSLRRIGAFLMLSLHLAIALTPPPGDIAGFGVVSVVRLAFSYPYATAAAVDEAMRCGSLTASMIAAAGIIAALTQPLPMLMNSQGEYPFGLPVASRRQTATTDDQQMNYLLQTFNLSVPLYGALLVLLLRVLVLDSLLASRPTSQPSLPTSRFAAPSCACMCRGLVVTVTFVYAILGPLLGFKDMGATIMFSNLALGGLSNHLFLPTGLLQAAHVGPFAGGYVEIIWTDLPWLRTLYPGDVRPSMSIAARARLAGAGHHGHFYLPGGGLASPAYAHMRRHRADAQTLETEAGHGNGQALVEDKPFVPYAVTVLELRRLLHEARRRGDNFSLTYRRLIPAVNSSCDEADRVAQSLHRGERGPDVIVTEEGNNSLCRYERTGAACTLDEPALALPPAYWLRKLTVGKPIPLPHGLENGLHCAE